MSRGIGIDYADLYQPGATAPDPARYDGLIFMGGAMSVNDGLPYLEQEARWIAQAVEARRPVLGVCLGAQLIAKASGARVYRNPVKEIGWFEIELTARGRRRPSVCRRSRRAKPCFNGTARPSICRRAHAGWLPLRLAATRHLR